MKFAGMQKLTLLDYPDRTACTLFTAGCNFACPYCQNPSLIAFEDALGALTEEYVLDFLGRRQGLLDGVCVSGGEPLAQVDLPGFARRVREMGFLLKIDTNGSFPGRLIEMAEPGDVDYVAMDIKNALGKYAGTAGIKGFDTAPVEESIAYLLSAGVEYEFRTTVVRELHTLDDLLGIARLISGADRYYLQSFANPETALLPGLTPYSGQEMQDMLSRVREVLPCTELRGIA